MFDGEKKKKNGKQITIRFIYWFIIINKSTTNAMVTKRERLSGPCHDMDCIKCMSLKPDYTTIQLRVYESTSLRVYKPTSLHYGHTLFLSPISAITNQELEVGPRNGPYLLVSLKRQEHTCL